MTRGKQHTTWHLSCDVARVLTSYSVASAVQRSLGQVGLLGDVAAAPSKLKLLESFLSNQRAVRRVFDDLDVTKTGKVSQAGWRMPGGRGVRPCRWHVLCRPGAVSSARVLADGSRRATRWY